MNGCPGGSPSSSLPRAREGRLALEAVSDQKIVLHNAGVICYDLKNIRNDSETSLATCDGDRKVPWSRTNFMADVRWVKSH